MALKDKLLAAGSIKNAMILSESEFFNEKEFVTTNLPILNIAFSGDIDGGLVSGLTIMAGLSKSFKSLLSLYCMKAYLDKYPNAIALLYDSEFGITPEYLTTYGVDTSRVIHIPIEHVEQLKFDIVKRLEQIDKGDKVFIMIDSLGALASKKEALDAMEEKSVADMSRAKAIRSLLRIITPHLTIKNIPCVVINHVYSEISLFPKTIVGGGSAVTYSSNQILIITKSQEKDKDGDLAGFKFTINIDKSRFVKEKSKLPFSVNFDKGINYYSSMLELALESGDIVKPNNGWYQLIDTETGECIGGKVREKDTECEEVLGVVMKRPTFKEFIRNKFKLSHMFNSNHAEQALDEETDIEEAE
jgi:RecA/RadA recombinase